MNPDLIAQYFNAECAAALAPLVTLAGGLLLLIVAEWFEPINRLRPLLFVGSILGAAWAEVALLNTPVPAVLGGTYSADKASAMWGLVFLASTLIAWVHARSYYRKSRPFLGEHDMLLLAAPMGMMMMAGALDLTVFFIGLELLSIPLYCLASFRRDRSESVEAGLKYFVLGAFSVGLFLYGVALVYAATGTLSLTALSEAAAAGFSPMAHVGMAFILGSLLFKLSIWPFHLWVPDVYQGAPTPVTILMATGTKAAALAFTLRITGLLPESSAGLIALLAVLTMAAGNLGALVQSNLKRLLAYSGVAHAGTLLLLVAAQRASGDLSYEATSAALFYMAAYVATAGGAFGLLAWLEADGEHFTQIESLKGLGRRRPGMAAAMTLFLLSLGGIPATGGFLAKWMVFSVTLDAHLTGYAIAGVLMSIIALAYYLRVIVAMYMEPASDHVAPPTAKRTDALVATAICAAAVLLMGILPNVFLGLI